MKKFGKERRRRAVLGGAVMASVMMASQAGGAQSASEIDVSVTGTPDTRFTARWDIVAPDGSHRIVEEQSSVPLKRHFEGVALQASITLLDAGRLQLDVEKGGNRSHSSTGGEGSRLNLSVR
ncbi:hypothetical protein [Kushneria aurantia]|uniref:Uncharacterized protein n=1 Tax=Kushneria aurantia TaxID=504092 RepID=A0ABV6FYT1_9GAMM|nr:hypothetical protein [Kushneria aurantia]